MNGWTENWNAFIDEISRLSRSGADANSIARTIGGAKVRWQGVVHENKLDGSRPGIDIEMPMKYIDVGLPRRAQIGGVYVPIADDSFERWHPVRPGDRVDFEASLNDIHSIFPPVEIHILSTGRTVVTVCVSEGRLIEHCSH